MNRRFAGIVLGLALGGSVVLGGCGGGDGTASSSTSDYTYDFTIPEGTGARVNQGEYIDLIPHLMIVTVGETIRIVNEDDRTHDVGPYSVPAGQTLVQTFTTPGRYTGVCSTMPGQEFVLVVGAAA
jgi:plastocyanin